MREELICIELYICNHMLFAFVFWKITPQGFYEIISLAFIHQYTDKCQFTIFTLMDKMGFHSVRPAIYLVFTGAVKVELQEFVPLVSNCCVTAIPTVDLDGMSIINNLQWRCIVINIYTLQLCLVSEGNTDRGLAFSSFAFGIFRFYITPVLSPYSPS